MSGKEREDWEREIDQQVRAEVMRDHPLLGVCRYVYFVSRSNGKGRKKRPRPREIEFLVYKGRAYMLKGKLTGELEWIMKSIFPEEMIPDEFGYDWYGAFLHVLRTMPKVSHTVKTSSHNFHRY